MVSFYATPFFIIYYVGLIFAITSNLLIVSLPKPCVLREILKIIISNLYLPNYYAE